MNRKASELLELVSNHELYFLQGGPKKYLCHVVGQLQAEGVLTIDERRFLSTTIYDAMDKVVGVEGSPSVFLLIALRKACRLSYDDDLTSEAYAREARKFWNETIVNLKTKGQ